MKEKVSSTFVLHMFLLITATYFHISYFMRVTLEFNLQYIYFSKLDISFASKKICGFSVLLMHSQKP